MISHKDELYKIAFRYFSEDGFPATKGSHEHPRFTEVTLYRVDTSGPWKSYTEVGYASAKAAPEDQFRKRTGRAIALARLINQISDPEFKAKVIDEYFPTFYSVNDLFPEVTMEAELRYGRGNERFYCIL